MSFTSIKSSLRTLLLVLAATIIAWIALAYFIGWVREPSQIGLTERDLTDSIEWARNLLGLAGLLAGFLGVAASAQKDLHAEDRSPIAEAAIIALLIGATLLEVGGGVPAVALVLAVVGGAAVRTAQVLLTSPPHATTPVDGSGSELD